MGVLVLARRSCELQRVDVEGLWAGGVYIRRKENIGYEMARK